MSEVNKPKLLLRKPRQSAYHYALCDIIIYIKSKAYSLKIFFSF